MADFIKKNMALVVVLAITFCAAVVLAYLALSTHSKVQQSIEEINENDDLVSKKIDKTYPNPVEESAELILADAEQIKQKTVTLQQTFGKPYNKMFDVFVAKLNGMQLTGPEVDAENEARQAEEKDGNKKRKKDDFVSVANPQLSFDRAKLTSTFESVYKKYQTEAKKKAPKEKGGRKNSGGSSTAGLLEFDEARELFNMFRDTVTAPPKAIAKDEVKAKTYQDNAKVKFDAAFEDFRQAVQPETLEEMTDDATIQILMQAMGLPRSMMPRDCFAYITKMYEIMEKSKCIPGSDVYNASELVRSFIYDPQGKSPPPENIVQIFRRFQIMEDLFMRLNRAGIKNLSDVVFENSLSGSNMVSGNYLKHTIQITVESHMDQIRELLNVFQQAYEDNRVYIVTEMELSRIDAKEVQGVDFGRSGGSRSGSSRPGAVFGGRSSGGDPDAISSRSSTRSSVSSSSGRMPMGMRQSGTASSGRMPMGMRQGNMMNNGNEYVDPLLLDPALSPEYGQPEIGLSELISGVITFDYIIYVGDEIKASRR